MGDFLEERRRAFYAVRPQLDAPKASAVSGWGMKLVYRIEDIEVRSLTRTVPMSVAAIAMG